MQVDPALTNQPLALVMVHYDASEVYLDGKLVQRFGTVGATPETEMSDHITRISHYGDLPITGDMITSTVRRKLQLRFGDAGHGFILAGKPWNWYGHIGVHQSVSSGWQSDPMFIGKGDHRFGLGGATFTTRAAELSMLFGDGAGAIVVSQQPTGGLALRVEDVLLATDGSFAEDLGVRAPGSGNGARWRNEEQAELFLPKMNGRTVILHAVRKLTEATRAILDRNQLSLDQIDWIVPHQANLNLLRALGKKLEIGQDRIIVNLDRYGNTSGTSGFLALHDAQSRLKPGARILVVAFGTGFTWGAELLTASP